MYGSWVKACLQQNLLLDFSVTPVGKSFMLFKVLWIGIVLLGGKKKATSLFCTCLFSYYLLKIVIFPFACLEMFGANINLMFLPSKISSIFLLQRLFYLLFYNVNMFHEWRGEKKMVLLKEWKFISVTYTIKIIKCFLLWRISMSVLLLC